MDVGAARAVLLTGPVGCGKTAIAMELGELLAARDLPSAVIDLDWLGWFHGPAGSPAPDELIVENLRSVWPRFRSAGARYLVLARALTTPAAVRELKDALPDVELVVVLVRASAETISARLGRRDQGEVLREHLSESAAMTAALESEGLEDLVVENEDAVGDVAQELFAALGWGESGQLTYAKGPPR